MVIVLGPTYVFAGAAKKLKVQKYDDTDSSLDWVAKGVLEMDEIKKTETFKGQAKTKATTGRAKSTGALQNIPQKRRATACVAASSQSSDAAMKKHCNLSIRAATGDQFGDAASPEDPRFVHAAVR